MNENQTLEMQIKAKSEEALQSLDKLINKLSKVEKTVNSTGKTLNNGSIKNVNKNIKDLDDSTVKATNNANKLNKALSLTGAYLGVKKLTTTFLSWMNESIDYTEQLNLFNVVFKNIEKNGTTMYSNLGKYATQFQKKMNEGFGTNEKETLQYQALYQSMANNVGINDEYSAIMSEATTKLTYDLASLYNKSEQTTAEALRAGIYAGQTKPLRNYGIDVTQMSLQPILDELGIDKQVKNMSQAEKEILRYIAVLRQSSVAHGDFANTVESPANQLKVFKNQLVEAKIALTSLFIGTFSKILPYANALLMVVKEVSGAIATMFGIKLTDYNSGIAGQEDAYTDLSDSVDGATDSVKELKRQTLGFDQINNINENKDSGDSNSTGGGIDQRLLDSISGYDNGLDKVRTKATDIRDRIMEWLGFTKEIDPLTGDVSFKLKEGYSNFKLICGIITTLIGLKIITGITKIAKAILGVDDLVKLSGNNVTWIGKIIKSLKINGWSTTIAKIGSKIKTILPTISKVGTLFAGVGLSIYGATSISDGFKDSLNGIETSALKTGASIASIAGGGALIGSTFGPLGTLIGSVVGGLASLIVAQKSYNDAIRYLAESDLFGKINISVDEWNSILSDSIGSVTDFSEATEEFNSKIESLSGTFNSSEEDLGKYGIKFGLLSKQITDEDSVNIKNAIETMCTSSSDIIKTSTDYDLDIWSKTFSNMSSLTEEEQKNILNSIVDRGDQQQNELKKAQENITSTYDTAIKTRGYLTDEEYNYISIQLAKIRELTETNITDSNAQMIYLKSQYNSDMFQLDKESYKNFKQASDDFQKEELKKAEKTRNELYNNAQKWNTNDLNDQKIYHQLMNEANEQYNSDTQKIKNDLLIFENTFKEKLMKKYDEIRDKTDDVSKEQRKIIISTFKDLDIDTSELENKISNAGKKFGQKLSNGFSDNLNINPCNFYNGINTMLGNAGKAINNASFSSDYLPELNNKNKSIFNVSYSPIAFANGGFPKEEDGLFFANHNEMVGKFSNGKTAVANNNQIVDGIKAGVYQAVAMAMSQSSGQSSQIDVHVHSDEGVIVDRINQRTKQTGICPIEIPV